MSYSSPPPNPYGPGWGGGYLQPRTNQKAVWSLVTGILGLVCCGLLGGIPALILGNTAKREIDASGGAETGRGMAQAGVIMGIISIVLTVLGFILVSTTGLGSLLGGGPSSP